MSNTTTTHGASFTTTTVHHARTVRVQGRDQLVQACGFSRRQLAYLYETTEPVNCRKCLAAHA